MSFFFNKRLWIIWKTWWKLEKVSRSIKSEFDSELVSDKKYLKTKIKSYKGKVNTNFHNTKTPKENSLWICLSVILIDSVFTTGNNYYPQVFCNVNMLLKKKRELSILLTT